MSSSGWQNAESVFIIMFQSRVSGGTYTELRKTEAGKDRLVRTLVFMGYDEKDIIVTEQKKAWKPDLRENGKRKKVNKNVQPKELRETTHQSQLLDGAEGTHLQ